MLVVGLTGGIGAGKSTVAGLLAGRGASVIDVDALGREILEPGGPGCEPVAARFGAGVVAPDGGIDRAALASVVFQDADALRDLEAISHPLINQLLERRVAAERASVVVLDMAVLVESRLGYRPDGSRLYEVVVVVEAPWNVRLARLSERGMSGEEAMVRRARQATDDQRRCAADFVVDNGTDRDVLAARVDELWNELLRRA